MPKFVKGSQEAKDHMAKLREMRGKKMVKMTAPACNCGAKMQKGKCTCPK